MAYKTVIRKSETSVTGVVLSMLLVIAIFTGLYLYMQQQATVNSVTINPKYSDTYTRLISTQSSIDSNVNDIKTNLVAIKEADDVYQVAWNGLKGLGNTLKLPISFVSDGVNILQALSIAMDGLPFWAVSLALTSLITIIVLLILAKLKGDQQL